MFARFRVFLIRAVDDGIGCVNSKRSAKVLVLVLGVPAPPAQCCLAECGVIQM